jgi:SAM-dependent methyltransferase
VEEKGFVTGSPADTTYFDKAYRDYRAQNPPRKLDHYLDEIESRVAPGAMDVLDIGCGLGAFLKRASERFPDWRLHGTDVEPSAISTTSRLVPRATVSRASAAETPYSDDSFDIITAWDVIEHVPDLERVAVSISRMLKPNGLFVFVVPVYDGLAGPAIRRLDKDPTHLHKEPRDAWLEWANQHFDSIEWHGLTRYLFGKFYFHASTTRFRRHTPAILVAARGVRAD